jgi:MFS family permease
MEVDLTGGRLHSYGQHMTATAIAAPASAPAAAHRLITAPLLRVLLTNFAGLSSFYLLLSVVPLYAASAGVGELGAGLATAALMGTTVAAEFGTPRMVARFGHRAVLMAGLILLGLPALALLASASMLLITVVSMLRGVGLAIIFVVCGELGASLVPAERRGEGLGVLGVVSGIPAVIAMPLSVWVVETAGFSIVFAAGALAALSALAVLPGLPSQPVPEPQVDAHPARGVLATARMPSVLRPAIAFMTTAMAAGVVATFLPAAVPDGSGGLAALALLAHAAAATLSRWWAGRFGDRHGAGTLLVPGVLVAAAGTVTLVMSWSEAAVLVGAIVFGAGFGAVQNASLATMYDQVDRSSYGSVTAVWSIAYDSGLGLGAAGFGLLVSLAGYGPGFAIMAVVMIVALPATSRQWRTLSNTSRIPCVTASGRSM